MRVLQVITKSEVGGAQSHVAGLIQGLSHHSLALATSGDGPLIGVAEAAGIPVFVIETLGNSLSPVLDLQALHSIRRAIRISGAELVHCHSSKAGFLGRLAARMEGVPSVFTAHGWGFSDGVPALRRLMVSRAERLAARWSGAIISVSEFDRTLAARYGVGSNGRHYLIRNGIPDSLLRGGMATADHFTRIVMVARFSSPKQQSLLIRALPRMKNNCRVVFAGQGHGLSGARTLASHLGLSEKITFAGNVTDVPLLLSTCHIACLFSEYEGLPVSILEAMRAELPVVASCVGGIPEAVEHGVSGFLIRGSDERDAAEALDRLVGDADLRIKMGRAGRKAYQEHFTLDRQVAELEAVYRLLADR